ncbi:sodium/glutamate symporter [Shimia marina]|uniref:Sodium/glutamate symporter n=1 Tax=Shimia marina TaxID=321267 RepID=A0A0P1ERR2_9RHOB|nr:sodium/glutamate symporter [Shimia marina]CUH52539.1 Glutamate permease [Shimia marina]SFE49389.1 glutamate:Na+ symporter, ESS family [Shimia marina]
MSQILVVPEMLTATLGFAVYLLGAQLTRKVAVLREFNIPEPVTGGLLAAAAFGVYSVVFGAQFQFEMGARDYFLVLFFAGIGLNARLSDLLSGGRLLGLLLLLTLATIIIQNIVGVLSAGVFGLPMKTGVLLGSASLIGGHGTAIAWAPNVAQATEFDSATELGVAMATLGLIAASLVGGPIAKYLIARNALTSAHGDGEDVVGVSFSDEHEVTEISHVTLMRVMLTLHVAIILGYILHGLLSELGLKLPLFVPCLIVGILLGNLRSFLVPHAPPVARTPTLAVVSEFALGVFLAVSLMTLDFSTLSGTGLAILATVGAQTLATVVLVLFVLFYVLGRTYDAAVLASGFAGFSLGATPTAIANMTAVTKRYGPAPIAFVVLPLVSAFFVDIANAVVIQTIVNF